MTGNGISILNVVAKRNKLNIVNRITLDVIAVEWDSDAENV